MTKKTEKTAAKQRRENKRKTNKQNRNKACDILTKKKEKQTKNKKDKNIIKEEKNHSFCLSSLSAMTFCF